MTSSCHKNPLDLSDNDEILVQKARGPIGKWWATGPKVERSRSEGQSENEKLMAQKSQGLSQNDEQLLTQKSQGLSENDKLLAEKSQGLSGNDMLQAQYSHGLGKNYELLRQFACLRENDDLLA